MVDIQEIYTWLIVASSIISLVLFFVLRGSGIFHDRDIPYLKPSPFVGNMRPGLLVAKREQFPDYIQRVYREIGDQPFGGIFNFLQPVILIKDPNVIWSIMVKDFEHFTDHQNLFNENETLMGKSLFHVSGKRWRDIRHILDPAFDYEYMRSMFVFMEECCQQMLQFLENCHEKLPEQHFKMEKEGDSLVIEWNNIYRRLANDVIATAEFGIEVNSFKEPENEFFVMGEKAFSFDNRGTLKLFLFLLSPTLAKWLGISTISKEALGFFKKLICETVAKREQENIVRMDMLHLLIEAKKNSQQNEKPVDEKSTDEKPVDKREVLRLLIEAERKSQQHEKPVDEKSTDEKGTDEELTDEKNDKDIEKKPVLTDEDIVAQVLAFFLAGYDTVSTTLGFITHELAIHPEIQSKVQEEVDEMLKNNKGKFTYDAICDMPYLDMVVSETLRLFPPVVADRLCVKAFKMEKSNPPIEFLPGDNIFIPIFALHRDAKYFPDPESFDPERFNRENHPSNPKMYIPFGNGSRGCLGRHFAMVELKLIIAHLLSKYSFSVVSKTPLPLKLMQFGCNMTVDGGFWYGLEPRNS